MFLQLGQTYFRLRAVIRDGRRYSGWRKRIYQVAQDHQAYYDFQKEISIGYEGSSDDLIISLLFKAESNALGLLGGLAVLQTQNSSRGGIQFNETFQVFQESYAARPILISHYKTEKSTSPDNSRADSVSVTTSYLDPKFQLRSFQDLSRMVKHEPLFSCHIASKALYPEYERDPNNIIYLNCLLHSFFDGDGKKEIPKKGGTPPRIRLDFLRVGAHTVVVGGVIYSQIYVNIHSYDREVLSPLPELKIREGYSLPDENNITTFFYSTDVEKTKSFLELKSQVTTKWWKAKFLVEGGVLDVEESFEEDDDEW